MEHTIETGGVIEVNEVFHQLVEKLRAYKAKHPHTWERVITKNNSLDTKWRICDANCNKDVDSLTLARRLAHTALVLWECVNEDEFTIVF